MSPPLSVSPEAAFIAASAASQIVTNDHDSHADTWYDQQGIEPSGETALVSPAALTLVNSFLDQLLFNFLSISGSTTLTSLRPAVSEVLKPKLAKDAINLADEELREYLGGGDDDTLLQQNGGATKDWDLELVWKRTRLRCMVYSSLGDMEEEDEDYYMEREHLEGGDEKLGETVSPAVAIFLTSILEFMGEQALVVAGQAAYHRMRAKYEKELREGGRSPVDVADRIVVEDLDMERVALDRTLGRLWRAWKKRIRSPGFGSMDQTQRPYSRDSNKASQFNHLRQRSSAESAVPQVVQEKTDEAEAEPSPESVSGEKELVQEEPETEPVEEYLLAASIPLPERENDVAEIEVPGLTYYSDEEESEYEAEEESGPLRPKSLMIFPQTNSADLPTPTTSQPHTPTFAPRKRSNSLPTPAASPYTSPRRRVKIVPVAAQLAETAQDSEKPEQQEIAKPDQTAANSQELTSENMETIEQNVTEEKPKRISTGPIATIVTGAAAVGTAAVAGLKAIAQGSTVQTEVESDEEDAGEIEDFVEEPEILTSSRISISGRSSSPAASDHGKTLTIQPTHPARSGSVHSLRLVDVTSPRSPTTRSRGSSIHELESAPNGRPLSLSRTSSLNTPPIVEEEHKVEDMKLPLRSPVAHSSISRSYTAESISEAEEMLEEPSESRTPTPPIAVSAPTPKAKRSASPREHVQVDTPMEQPQPIFGSAVRERYSPPQSPAKTKVTILSSSTSNGTFFMDDKPEPPVKPVQWAQPPAPAPTLPERNVSRQVNGKAYSPPQSHVQSMGNVSVDRTRESPEYSRPSQDQSTMRQLHTSGSSTASSTNKVKPVRASHESSRPEEVARNFEELIQSDQTIQYTLTPENMRDFDNSTSSPIMPVRSRKSEDARNGNRSRSSSVNRPAEIKRSTSVSRPTGLNSHPVSDSPSSGRLAGPVPRAPPVSMQNRNRGSGPQARDARVPRESLADFAEFIRATGPPGESGPAAYGRGASAVRNASGPIPVTAKTSIDSGRASTATNPNRHRYEAREPVVNNRDDNSDLIDFIRRGPPSAHNPRIPRTVAPFRTTMDSDQLQGAVGGKAVDAMLPDIRHSQASTNVTDMSMPSVQSSINSQSALLGSSSSRNKPLPQQSKNQFDDDDMLPKRKQRRVRDPYAIDFSDEEEDDLFEETPRRKAPPKEESLIDFLKNAPPPPETSPVPFNIQQAQAQNAPLPKKKASASSLIARFGRTNSSHGKAPGSPTTIRGMMDFRSSSSRSGSISNGRHVPIQANAPPVRNQYGGGNYGATSGGVSGMNSSSMGGRVPMKKFQARDATPMPSRETSDLAEFLRNSEPPPSMTASPYGGSADQDTNGFAKVFARRKKASFA
ncbi:hypothetical protein UCRPA7_5659 [Phaeoacremonium minimum UCRPA7]|uniref:Uncharacterized protein n=1 Tax=Phaeoacremonium minimum (strain UCR-PA7) TaxID=1286976 RepID=R8BHP6_PHAM7|nr:hypothetical protein UCRPA7_5659 [Phaeoacremonium minimum UCRPA7]EON98821.1 hypothetical protein UCRPA7_5659 [Phaeoacremonium minimum UCRPA7]